MAQNDYKEEIEKYRLSDDTLGFRVIVSNYKQIETITHFFDLPSTQWSFLNEITHTVNKDGKWPICLNIHFTTHNPRRGATKINPYSFGWDPYEEKFKNNSRYLVYTFDDICSPIKIIEVQLRKEINEKKD